MIADDFLRGTRYRPANRRLQFLAGWNTRDSCAMLFASLKDDFTAMTFDDDARTSLPALRTHSCDERIGRDSLARPKCDTAGSLRRVTFDRDHLLAQAKATAHLREESNQSLDQRTRASFREPHAPPAFQFVDERVDRRAVERISADE